MLNDGVDRLTDASIEVLVCRGSQEFRRSKRYIYCFRRRSSMRVVEWRGVDLVNGACKVREHRGFVESTALINYIAGTRTH